MKIDVLQKMLDGKGVVVIEFIDNTKASEHYVRTTFTQDDGFTWNTVVPCIDRRAGLDIDNEKDLSEYLISLKPYFERKAMADWKRREMKQKRIKGAVTQPFFKVLLSFKEEAEKLPRNNNGARRIQDIKDAGYTIASIPNAKGRMTSRILLPIPLHAEMKYETFTPQFKARVIRLLKERNAFEARVTNKKALVPDHKFSEVRWDENTKAENSLDMTDEEIVRKFQLLDNQRNQQKRETCRKCFQEGIRGTIYGINYFYKGTENWNSNIPIKGKEAEKGCEGCPWYDIEEWRKMLNEEIENRKQ
jgi:hypothetical protein